MIEQTTVHTDLLQEVRKGISGIDATITTPYHTSIPIVYADWTASGRMFVPIEERMNREIYPFVANTHTETNSTGRFMTQAYHEALSRIKQHVNAGENDSIICEGSGMTGVVNKFQRILGIKVHEAFKDQLIIDEVDQPVVFVTHMEHHSNHISWSETIAKVCIIPADEKGLPDLVALELLLQQHAHRKHKFASVTAASNVTGMLTPYHAIARLMHQNNGLCFVDFACAAPYITMNMHPENPEERLDAIFFSPHKFLGGPGSSGVLIFSNELYHNTTPDHPGGGTVVWTSPYRSPIYFNSIEEREDGGTPGFLQVMRIAMAIQLKEQISVDIILKREKEQVAYVLGALANIDGLTVLEARNTERLGVFSFTIDQLYQQLGVRMLNDHFGIQVRGGCSCAGTYAHYLLGADETTSCSILERFQNGEVLSKPGWIRMSIHPTTSNAELEFICSAIKTLAEQHKNWSTDYNISPSTGKVTCLSEKAETPISLFRPF